jgi:predicted unusual protein kinase regulating ubiquinone biosynthesis (AarF/ABC1/UbiB family)
MSPSPPPSEPELGGRLSRASNLARLSASAGAGYLSSRLRGPEAEQRFHAETAERMLELLGSMKGAAMKLGQIASFVDLDLPPEVAETYRSVLADLRAAAPPVDPGSVAAVVRDEYGASPQDVFASWKPEPIAAASIGQVHRARLPDGSEVAVKVQYPGVAEAIEADLANAEMFVPLARLVSPNLRVRPLVEELRDRVIDELDYQREAQYQQAFAERYHSHPFIRVPRVYADWSRPRVLVTEYLEGLDFDTMLATTTDEQRQRYGEIIYRFVYGSLNRFRLFNADPHPGNYLFPDDGTVVFLDFGSVKLFPSRTRDEIRTQLAAVVDGDIERLRASLTEAGFLPPGEVDMDKLAEWFRLFNEPILGDREWTYTPEFAREVIRTTTDPRLGYVDLLRRLNLPPDYLALNRIQWGVNSILGRLGARRNWYRIMLELWDDGPPATDLGRQEHPFIAASPFRA